MNHWFTGIFSIEGTVFASLPAFITSLGIGLLLGIERERKKNIRAGIRTFALTSLLGTLSGLLAENNLPLFPIATLFTVAAFILTAYWHPAARKDAPDATTQIALLVAYCLGLLVWHGLAALAVALAILSTLLLYLKPELSGLSHRLSRQDILALLQFGVVSAIILPVLPDRPLGPFGAINLYETWLMVVLISGVGLLGYLAVRMLGERLGGPLLGLLGGLVSSTATSLAFAREARSDSNTLPLSTMVIQLANLVIFVRIAVLAALLAPGMVSPLLIVLGCALVAGMVMTWLSSRSLFSGHHRPAEGAAVDPKNPVEMGTALLFGGLYAGVTFAASALTSLFGHTGFFGVALISGLTDVDAISLTAFNQFTAGKLPALTVTTAIALALLSNTLFKFSMIASLGGQALVRRCAPMFAATSAGLVLGLVVVWQL